MRNRPIIGRHDLRRFALLGWFLLGMAPAIHLCAQIPQAADRGCLLSNCHGKPGAVRTLEDGAERRLSVDLDEIAHSAHKDQACMECHTDIQEIPHPATLGRVDCENCHFEKNPKGAPNINQFREYIESIHGRKAKEGDPHAPTCATCHGQHDIQAANLPTSRIHRNAQPTTCGECHETEHGDFSASVHGRDLAEGNPDVPTCTTCHGVHRIQERTDPNAPTFSVQVVETCSQCHAAVEIAAKYDFSVQRVASYKESFHGFANNFSVTVVANCASCHGVHKILPQSDPASTIHPANLLRTCGQENCHPKATAKFASGQVHLGVAEPEAWPVRAVRWAYTALIVGVIGGMAIHNVFDLRAQFKRRQASIPSTDSENGDDAPSS